MSVSIVIISGLPGTGKTYLGKQLATELHIPLVSKDGFKETLFNTLGMSDREWSKKLGMASLRLLDYVFVAHLETSTPLIVEGNFNPKFENERFTNFAKKYDAKFIQIFCYADGEVLLERFKRRAESKERHPGHMEVENMDEFRDTLLQGRAGMLDLPGETIELDTTDFSAVNYEDVVGKVRALMS